MERIEHEELKAIISNDTLDKYSHEELFRDTKYYFESMKSAPFFGRKPLVYMWTSTKNLAKKAIALHCTN